LWCSFVVVDAVKGCVARKKVGRVCEGCSASGVKKCEDGHPASVGV